MQTEVFLNIEECNRIAEKFSNGVAYLSAWRSDAGLRAEFEGDFEAYCHYKNAIETGRARVISRAV